MIHKNELQQTTCSITFTIDDIYGKRWLSDNLEELNKKYNWSFKQAVKGDLICGTGATDIDELKFDGWFNIKGQYPVIVLEKKIQYEYVTDGVMRKPVEGDYIIENDKPVEYDGLGLRLRAPQSQLVFKRVEKKA